MPASCMAAWMRSVSRPLLPGQPVSTSSEAPDGSDQQRGLAAFDIDGVDEQVPCSGLRCGVERRGDEMSSATTMSERTGKKRATRARRERPAEFTQS